jgi:hypothetical protein
MEGFSREEHGIRFLQYLKFINAVRAGKTEIECETNQDIGNTN